MATKTFTTEFKLNSKGAINFLDALDQSERVDLKMNHEIKNVHDKPEIKNLISKLVGK